MSTARAGAAAPALGPGVGVVLQGLFVAPLESRVLADAPPRLFLAPPSIGGVEIPLPLGRPFRLARRAGGTLGPEHYVLVAAPTADVRGYVAERARPTHERRRADRARVRLDAHITPRGGRRSGPPLAGTTVDLSASGALIGIRESGAVPAGRGEGYALFPSNGAAPLADLWITLGASGAIRATGSVVRCEEAGPDGWIVAFSFLNVALADRGRFKRFLAEQRQRRA